MYVDYRNREGTGMSYRPARLHRLAESIPELLKSLKIPSLLNKDMALPIVSHLKEIKIAKKNDNREERRK
jgi:hypothetical protein